MARRRRGVGARRSGSTSRALVCRGSSTKGALGKLKRSTSSRAVGDRRLLVADEGSSRTMCHLKLLTMYTVSLVRLTGGSSTRVVGDCSTSTRAAEFPGALDVDEGVEGRCRDRRASCLLYNLATQRVEAVTGLELLGVVMVVT